MKQKIIETTKARLLVVDLPNGASGIKVSDCKITIDINYGFGNQTYATPPGNWELLGKPEDVSGDDMVSVLGGQFCNYCSLEKKGVYGVPGGYVAGCEGSRCSNTEDTIREHFNELLESKITLANPLGEKPYYSLSNYGVSPDGFKRFEKDLSAWQAAEEKVFKNPILLYEAK